ncbi:TetR family transcriptional regulator [Roseiarcus fermentans]|uniref:TetR family transcriptional regulator n=1 Tax=Roseiarcus fermentans TaxID=1473586 RepID=A0A366F3N6_9HYPH|nr:TetR/AcrR family transcriptional regulator [Roseiarcus fermentans]RBP09217.1 TetR family transcriptional regulator [Roseiarcus fermentans]
MTALAAAPGGGARATTREDWLDVALALLARRGAGAVSVLTLSERLGVSRSSFYWHFRSREGLFDALLERWDARNTRSIVRQAEAEAATITESVCNVFRCWVNPALFSPRLDVAVRAWARASDTARARLDAADRERTAAIEAMFARHGFAPDDAMVRARVLYTMQIGYYALDMREPIAARLALAPRYLETFTGVKPRDQEVAALRAYALAHAAVQDFEDPS